MFGLTARASTAATTAAALRDGMGGWYTGQAAQSAAKSESACSRRSWETGPDRAGLDPDRAVVDGVAFDRGCPVPQGIEELHLDPFTLVFDRLADRCAHRNDRTVHAYGSVTHG